MQKVFPTAAKRMSADFEIWLEREKSRLENSIVE